jgi:hypothetical protein
MHQLILSAAPASGSFAYQTGDAAGIKYGSRDLSGPTTTLALVSRAGTRYQWLPGLAEGLEKFSFKVRWALTKPQGLSMFLRRVF